MLLVEAFNCVHRSEDLCKVTATLCKFKRHFLAFTDEAMGADRKPMAIDLVAVPHSGLHHSTTSTDIADEPTKAGDVIARKVERVASYDSTQKNASQSWSRLDRQNEVS
jgi:hypothetical protein